MNSKHFITISMDVWCQVVEYLCTNIQDIINLSTANKYFRNLLITQCKCTLIIPPNCNERSSSSYITKLLHNSLSSLMISSHPKFNDEIILKLIQSYPKSYIFKYIAISKCFSVKDRIILLMNHSVNHLGLCDMTFTDRITKIIVDSRNESISNHESTFTKSLIFTNSTFTINAFIEVIRLLPSSLRFLGLGGCQIEKLENLTTQPSFVDTIIDLLNSPRSYDDIVESSVYSPLSNVHCLKSSYLKELSKNLIIETTFLSVMVKDILACLFPNAIFLDMVHDRIDYVEAHFSEIELHYSFRSLLTNSSDCYNRSVLHHACINGDRKKVEWLCRQMMSRVDLKDSKGATAIQRAIENNQSSCIRSILDTYLSYHSMHLHDSETKLPSASLTDLSGCLLSNKLNRSSFESSKEFPDNLGLGQTNGKYYLPVVGLLSICNHYCETPIYLAALYGREESLRTLLDYIPGELSYSILHFCGRRKSVVNDSISSASAIDNFETASTQNCGCLSVFSKGSMMSFEDFPMNEIIREIEELYMIKFGGRLRYRFEDLRRICIQSLNLSRRKSSRRKNSPVKPDLSYSVFGTSTVTNESIIVYDCSMFDLLFCDDRGYSPLHAAVINKSANCVKILLEMGCRPNYPNNSMETPLQLACSRYPSHHDIIQLLMNGQKSKS